MKMDRLRTSYQSGRQRSCEHNVGLVLNILSSSSSCCVQTYDKQQGEKFTVENFRSLQNSHWLFFQDRSGDAPQGLTCGISQVATGESFVLSAAEDAII